MDLNSDGRPDIISGSWPGQLYFFAGKKKGFAKGEQLKGKDGKALKPGSASTAFATDWDGDLEVKRVNPSRPDSYERQFHDSGEDRFLLDLSPGRHEALRRRLGKPRLERFIGVIYRPETELMSHYSQAVLPDQFDAFLWFDETRAVTPLGPEHHRGVPETYPFGE